MKARTIITKVAGKIWTETETANCATTFVPKRGYTKKEAEEAIKTMKAALKENGIKANVTYFWSEDSDKPMKLAIKVR